MTASDTSQGTLTLNAWLQQHKDLDRLDVHLAAADVLECSRADIIADNLAPLSITNVALLNTLCDRLRAGEPLAYVLGRKEFWGLSFLVDSVVLIPRPETELVVEWTLELTATLQPRYPLQILDLGTGSGCIAVALAYELADKAHISATEASAPATLIAEQNAANNNVGVTFIDSDWLQDISGQYDVIVSNPPYIAPRDPHLAQLGNEPPTALISPEEGLADLTTIINTAPAQLNDGGWLVLEHGYQQGSAVVQFLRSRGFTQVQTRQDLAGLDRVSAGRWHTAS